MRRQPLHALLALLASLLCTPAFAADSGLGQFTIEVREKGAAERCLKLEAGQSIRYHFTAAGEVDFNIHFHRGDEIRTPVERRAVGELDGVFRAESTEDYCLMWERRQSGAVKVTGRIEARQAAATR